MTVEIKDEKYYKSLSERERVGYVADLIRSKVSAHNDRGDFRYMHLSEWTDGDLWDLFISSQEEEAKPEDLEGEPDWEAIADRLYNND